MAANDKYINHGTLWYNEDRPTEKHPDWSGTVTLSEDVIEELKRNGGKLRFSGWSSTVEARGQSTNIIRMKFEPMRERAQQADSDTVKKGRAPSDLRDDSIPF